MSETPTSPPPSYWSAFRRLLTFWGPFKWQVTLSAVLSFVIVGAQIAIPNQAGEAVNHLTAGDFDRIQTDALLIVAFGLIAAVVSGSRRLVAGSISLGIEQMLRTQLFDKLATLSLRYHDRHQTGQLLSRVTSDVSMVRFFLGYGLTYFFMHIVKLLAVPVAMWLVSPLLAAVVLATMPLILIASIRFSRRSNPIVREVQQRVAEVTAHGEEAIVGARVVRAFGQEDREVRRFAHLTGRVVAQERRATLVAMRYRPLYDLIPNLTLALVLLLSARLYASGDLLIGDIVKFYGFMLLLTGPLRILGNLLARAQRATASASRLWEVLDADDHLPEASTPRSLPRRGSDDGRLGSRIDFRSVSFGYRDGHPVVDGVTLAIEPGSTLALIGPTGCGKTTLASLLPRFYDVSSGSVLLDGIDVRQLALRELRRSIGIVDQEPFLFSATVADNLRYGNADATDAELWRALHAAQAAEFVERLPDGIATLVGERGLTLSGGQRQRLSIARALVTDPRVLILDDATASVDSRVEARIRDALGSASAGRTTIVIAHRPSTIAMADRVAVMREGRLEDLGTHSELLARSTTYQRVQEQRAARREFLVDPAAAPAPGDRPGGAS